MDNVRRRQGGSGSAAVGVNGLAHKQQEEMSMSNGDGGGKTKTPAETPTWVYALLVLFAVITVVTYPVPFQPHGEPTLKHVFFYGWMTAISTGCGVLPFMVMPNVPKFWVGISNGKTKRTTSACVVCLFSSHHLRSLYTRRLTNFNLTMYSQLLRPA